MKNNFDSSSISSRFTSTTINNKPSTEFNGVLHPHTSNIKGVLLKDNEIQVEIDQYMPTDVLSFFTDIEETITH